MPRGQKELAEQIIPKLREVEVEVGRGKTVLEAVKKIGVTEQTHYRWKKKFGGLLIDQAKRLKDLEKENARMGAGQISFEPSGICGVADAEPSACHPGPSLPQMVD